MKKRKNPRDGLNQIQLELFEDLVDIKTPEIDARYLIDNFSTIKLRQVMGGAVERKISVVHCLARQFRYDELNDEQKKLLHVLTTNFCYKPGDDEVAALMVEDYDTESVNQIIGQFGRGSINICEIANDHIVGKCMHRIQSVEANGDLKKDLENVPF